MDWSTVQDVVAAVVNLANEPFVVLAGGQISVMTLVIFTIIVGVTYGVSRVLQQAAVRALRSRGITDEGSVGITRRLLHYSVMGIGIAVGLQNVGIELGALFAAGAVFAVGIGFAMQNIVQNFVSGVILLVERAIKPSDVLEVDGRVVRVEKMGIRATVARTRDEEQIIIPNSILVGGSVKNFTLADSMYRVRAAVGVKYESDLETVARVLYEAAESRGWRRQDREPVVLLREFGNSSVNFEVSVWVDDPWRSPGALSELNDAVWWALREAGITIAFPQMDVHFDEPVETGFSSLEAVG